MTEGEPFIPDDPMIKDFEQAQDTLPAEIETNINPEIQGKNWLESRKQELGNVLQGLFTLQKEQDGKTPVAIDALLKTFGWSSTVLGGMILSRLPETITASKINLDSQLGTVSVAVVGGMALLGGLSSLYASARGRIEQINQSNDEGGR